MVIYLSIRSVAIKVKQVQGVKIQEFKYYQS